MLRRIVILSALGYFVDILDLFLFSVLRVPSLKALGVPDSQLMATGITLLNSQMVGLLVGSFFWGVLGDRKGRVKVLYGSILLYSTATTLNAFAPTVAWYAFFRFVAGVGLSGELGAAITLVSESMESRKRGIGTTLVAGFGLCGGILAAVLAQYFSWQTCYLIGGGCGFALLVLRVSLPEPPLFLENKEGKNRGNLFLLFKSWTRFKRLAQLVLIGVPIWFVSGILIVFSPEFGKVLHIQPEITAAKAVLYSYFGVALGDFLSGGMSQWWHTRKKVVAIFLAGLGVSLFLYLNAKENSAEQFYGICFLLGIATGYWAMLVTMAAENFGTNLRATVATLVPNLVRASVIPLASLFEVLHLRLGILHAAAIVGTLCLATAFYCLWQISETYERELKFLEAD